MSAKPDLDFQHVFLQGSSSRTLLLLHGTGGHEDDLLPLGLAIDSAASRLSPRGKVLENGMPRFFRRLAEGIFDEKDLVRRTRELADFVAEAAKIYRFDACKVVAVGYSNGANIAGALLLLRPGSLAGAALLRPMVPLVPQTLPDLSGVSVLVSAGQHDPLVPPENPRRLAALLGQAGAEVTLRFENSGHALNEDTVAAARQWLAGLKP
jgi:phospholipase/carboxylesterase